MARYTRIQFPGAIYHITARGSRRHPIFLDDRDRRRWLDILDRACTRCEFKVYAYCQMTNHFHLLLETPLGNLDRGMQQLNGGYAQSYNWRHALVGHLLQGRFHAILVQKESYLLEVMRYVVLNPVRAGIVPAPEMWNWSSYPTMLGARACPRWLDAAWVLRQFDACEETARTAYRQFVHAGIGGKDPLEHRTSRLVLGDQDFVDSLAEKAERESIRLSLARRSMHNAQFRLSDWQALGLTRGEAMARAFLSGAYKMVEIAAFFGVSTKTVSRAVRQYELKRSDADSE